MVEGWDVSDLWPEFEAEVQEHLTQLEDGLLALEARGEDRDLVNELFRSAHTIKGAARMMEVDELANIAGRAEGLLHEVREGKRAVDAALISELLRMVDAMRSQLEAHKPRGEEAPSESLGEEQREKAPSPATPEGHEWRPQSTPETEDVRHLEAGTTIRLQPRQVQHLTQAATVLRMQYMRLREVYRQLEGLLIHLQSASTLGAIGEFPEPALAPSNGRKRTLYASDHASAHLVAEVVSELEQLQRHFLQTVEGMGITLHDLEDQILGFRLVPFTTLVPFLRRIVRDAAQALGKEVTLEIQGEDTLIDRQLMGPLQDMFIHLLRNAVDHGIEPPEVREARGKSREGHIRLRLGQVGGQVRIEVEDDGAGVNIDKVRERAVARGLIQEAEARQMNDEHLLQLLFYPGFSTRSRVSVYSGQGVGLDVVAQTVRRLGGDIHMTSSPGSGTRIVITLPLNLALVDAMIVRVGTTRVALALNHVEAVLNASRATVFDSPQGPMLLWQEMLIPVASWGMMFPDLEVASGTHIIVVSSHHRFVAVRGGTVEENLVLSMHPLPALLMHVDEIYGASILGDGSVVFLLTVDTLLARLAQIEGEGVSQ